MTAWTFSATDRVTLCPASAALPQVYSTTSTDAADWGTGVHKYLRDCAVIGLEAARKALPKRAPWRACCLALDPGKLWVDVPRYIEQVAWNWNGADRRAEWVVAYNVTTGEAREYGCDLDRAYPDLGPEWVCGTIDLAVLRTPADDESHKQRGEACVYDYKTGHTAPRAYESGQLMLAALAMAALSGVDSVTVGIVHIREDGSHTVDEYTYEAWDLDAAREQVREVWRKVQRAKAEVILRRTPDVTTGPHCRWCPAIHACHAQTALARHVALASELDDGKAASQVSTMTSERAGEAWQKLGQARRLLDEIERALKARIDHDGSLPLPDGSEVRAQSVTRESIDAEKALPVLAELLDVEPSEVPALFETRITKADLERVCKASDLDTNAVLGALRSVGAVPSRETTSYVTKKAKERAA